MIVDGNFVGVLNPIPSVPMTNTETNNSAKFSINDVMRELEKVEKPISPSTADTAAPRFN